MSASSDLTVHVTLVPTKAIFSQPFKRTPPGKLQPISIHTIQTQQCGFCAPLFIKATTEKDSNLVIMDIDEETPEFEHLFYSLQKLVNTMKGQKQLTAKHIDILDYMEILIMLV